MERIADVCDQYNLGVFNWRFIPLLTKNDLKVLAHCFRNWKKRILLSRVDTNWANLWKKIKESIRVAWFLRDWCSFCFSLPRDSLPFVDTCLITYKKLPKNKLIKLKGTTWILKLATRTTFLKFTTEVEFWLKTHECDHAQHQTFVNNSMVIKKNIFSDVAHFQLDMGRYVNKLSNLRDRKPTSDPSVARCGVDFGLAKSLARSFLIMQMAMVFVFATC